MRSNKTQIIFALFAALAVLYAVNIFLTKSVAGLLIDEPAKISFVILEPPAEKCGDCFDANLTIKRIENSHNVEYKTSSFPYGSALSQKYIEMYGIKTLPAIVVSGDVGSEKVKPAWQALGGQEKDGQIVIGNMFPYYDLESGQVKGVISAVVLEDKTCESCFDGSQYLETLKRFGLFVGDANIYDVSSKEGRALVEKYAVKKVPALILSPAANDYPGFADSWQSVGTIEKDGWFVFREVQQVSPEYKKL